MNMVKNRAQDILLTVALLIWSLIFSTNVLSQSPSIEKQNPQASDWHYTLRPNDKFKSVASRLLNNKHNWEELALYNRIDDANVLRTGSILKIPLAWLNKQPRPVTTNTVKGDVFIKRGQTTHYEKLKADMKINVGDTLISRNGSAELEFADQSTLELNAHSLLTFNKISYHGNAGMVDTRMRLVKGGLRTKVSPLVKGARYEINTPSAVAAVRGTEFRLRTNVDGTTLEVLEGKVNFTYAYGSELIEQGQGARVFAQRAGLEKKNLYIPTNLNSTSTTRIIDEQEDSSLAWQGIPVPIIPPETKGNNQRPNRTLTNNSQNVNLALRDTNSDYDNPILKNRKDERLSAPTLALPLPGSILDSISAQFSWNRTQESQKVKLQLAGDEAFKNIVRETDWSVNDSQTLGEDLVPGNYYWRVKTRDQDMVETFSKSRNVTIRGLLESVNILSVNYINNQVGIFWHSIDNVDGYTLQIADNENFLSILKEETLSKTSAYLKLPKGQRYYARVKGLNSSFYNSNFGPIKELYVEMD